MHSMPMGIGRLSAFFCSTILSGAALAQSGGEVPRAAAQAASTQDIIVTAQRRDERLSRTPVAVAVIGSETLAKAQITSQQDLQIATPGLQVRATSGSNDLNYAIRGQSLDPYSAARPGVLPYFNEVQVGGSGTASAFYDLQSVQVLKGPQGTLFGRNATGGAVLFTSAAPTDELSGYGSVGYGNYASWKAEGAISGPIVAEKVTARIAGIYQSSNGFQTDIIDDRQLGKYDRYGLRGSVNIELGSVKNETVLDYFHAKGTNLAPVLSGLNPAGGFPTTQLYTDAVFPDGSGPLTGTSVSDFVLSQILQSQGLPADVANAAAAGNYARYIAAYGGNPAVPAGGIGAVLAQQQARGPYKVASGSPNTFRTKNWVLSNRTTVDLSDTLQLKNIFGYTHLYSFQNLDNDGSPFVIAEGSLGDPDDGLYRTTEQFSNELQLLGETGSLKYVVGGYYAHESLLNLQSTGFFDILLGGLLQRTDARSTSETWAGYAQATLDLSDSIAGLSITGGLRYTSEKIRLRLLPSNAYFGLAAADPATYDNDQSKTYKNVGWTFSIQEQATPDLLFYAATRRSYKNGGFNLALAPKRGFADVAGNGYRTEKVTDAELGSKFAGLLGSMPARINVALFYNWIENSQRTAFTLVAGAPSALTANVPKAEVYGIEFDGTISPTDWLTIGGSANYTKAKFTSQSTFVAGNEVIFGTYPDTPKFSGALFADVTVPVQGDIELLLHGDVYRQTMTYFSSTANLDAGAFNKGYTLANFRIGVQDKEAGWSLTANLKNAFDKEYYVGGIPLGQLVQINSRVPGQPRTAFVEARYTF